MARFLMSIKKINVPETKLSLEEQLELGKRMSAGDTKAREKLVLSCIPLVKSYFNTPLCKCYSLYDDILQDGMTGALEAVDKYDYTKNTMFTTFAYVYIHKSILKGIISRAPLKISDKDFFNSILLNSTIDSFCAAYQVPPTREQLAKLTGIPLKDIDFLLNRNINKISINFEDDSDLIFPEEDVSIAVEKTLQHSLQKKLINEAFELLTNEEKEIIQKRFLYKNHKASLKELALLQNVSMEAVRKREKSALKKLFTFFISNNITGDDVLV